MFRLEQGVTGFHDRGKPPPPVIGPRMFRAACHAAARAAGGRVVDVVESSYPRSFHLAVIMTADEPHTVLCQAHHSLIAFVVHGTCGGLSPGVFVDPPGWAAAFTDTGFTVMGGQLLDAPLSDVDTSALTAAEWSQIRYWRPSSVGETVFNCWD